jgi:small subunit ribosomal protein S8
MQHDPLSDAMTLIKNAEMTGHIQCDIRPSSKLIGHVLRVMQENGYIGAFEFVEDGKAGSFKVQLTGAINKCGAIKPRFAARKDELEKWEKRFLPAQDFGLLIMTTTKGVLSHKQAKEQGVGGKLLAYVY